MSSLLPSKSRILAISPSSRGFGFAVLEGGEILVDWGAKRASGNKNEKCLQRAMELMDHYQPGVLALSDYSAQDYQRSERLKKLGQELLLLAKSRKIDVALISRKRLLKTFYPKGVRTKLGIAQILAERFPEELGLQLPPKRRPWTSEDYRMDIFDAVAMAVTFHSLAMRRRSQVRRSSGAQRN